MQSLTILKRTVSELKASKAAQLSEWIHSSLKEAVSYSYRDGSPFRLKYAI